MPIRDANARVTLRGNVPPTPGHPRARTRAHEGRRRGPTCRSPGRQRGHPVPAACALRAPRSVRTAVSNASRTRQRNGRPQHEPRGGRGERGSRTAGAHGGRGRGRGGYDHDRPCAGPGPDRGVFTGRPVDVLVCRATADSLVRAARAAYLISTQQHHRPVLAVNTADPAGPSRPSVARMPALEPHTAGVVVLPYVRRWRDLATPLQDVTGLLTRPVTELPRPLRRFASAVNALAHSLDQPTGGTPPPYSCPLPTDPLRARLAPPHKGANGDLPPSADETLLRPRPRHHGRCPATGSAPRATAGTDRDHQPARVVDEVGRRRSRGRRPSPPAP